MGQHRPETVRRLVSEARARSRDDRDAFLRDACGGDTDLRDAVERALEEATLEIGSADLLTATDGPSRPGEADLPPGARVGPYRVVRRLGSGGQGVVYLAERDDAQYERRVAVKVVPRGLGTDLAHRLFRYERQILASLDHPNIARLLDAGTTDGGFPYFVMEYVEGEPIDAYCARLRFGVREKVGLFRAVCDAVQHAHRNLVVHRDLKPGNILISGDGVPKLLDFGIAKLLEPGAAAARTVTVGAAMTPDYASPEQVRFETISTATDVYSLGVILYELLTGRRPYQLKSLALHDVTHAICEEEPRRPSAVVGDRLARELRGDLDTIVMKALEKSPARRYASVEAFAEDLLRWMEARPVLARPDSVLYRAGKLLRRHRAGVTAAGLVLLSLVGGIVATTWQARRADAQRLLAERRFTDVRGLAHTLLFEVHDSIENLAGATTARELLVRRGLAYLDRLATEAADDPALELELGAAYQKLGDIQGRPGFANLGDREGALASYRKALALREAVPESARDVAYARDLATNHDRVGDSHRLLGDSAGALESYRRALALREGLAGGASRPAPEDVRDLGRSHQRLGDVLAATGDTGTALGEQRRALELFESAAREPGTVVDRDLYIGRIKLGDRLLGSGDTPGALESYREALELGEALAARDPADARARRELAAGLDKVANALTASGDLDAALALYRRALVLRESLAGQDPRNAELRRDVSVSHVKIGDVALARGGHDDALASYRRALAVDEAALRQAPGGQARLDVSLDHENLGRTLQAAGRPGEASREYVEALRRREELARADPGNLDLIRQLVDLRATLAVVTLAAAGPSDRTSACDEAAIHLRGAREAAARLATPSAPPEHADVLAEAKAALARCRSPR